MDTFHEFINGASSPDVEPGGEEAPFVKVVVDAGSGTHAVIHLSGNEAGNISEARLYYDAAQLRQLAQAASRAADLLDPPKAAKRGGLRTISTTRE